MAFVEPALLLASRLSLFNLSQMLPVYTCALESLRAGWGGIFRFSKMCRCFSTWHLTGGSVIPNLVLETFLWTGLKLTIKCYPKVDGCISTALASRMSVSMLSFRGRRDVESAHTKGQDRKGQKLWIMAPRQIQSRCLKGTLQVYKCAVVS